MVNFTLYLFDHMKHRVCSLRTWVFKVGLCHKLAGNLDVIFKLSEDSFPFLMLCSMILQYDSAHSTVSLYAVVVSSQSAEEAGRVGTFWSRAGWQCGCGSWGPGLAPWACEGKSPPHSRRRALSQDAVCRCVTSCSLSISFL